ncbi:MAG: hypothetical protein ACJ75B_01325 [Flavisolibacter sp.]
MQVFRWIALAMAVVLIISCFYPWVSIEPGNIVISGFHSDISDYGKPGILHAFITALCILFLLFNRAWSIRTAFFVSVFNIAWAFRNFMILAACRGGICPVKHIAVYMVLLSSIAFSILIAIIKPKQQTELKEDMETGERIKRYY